MSGRLPILVAGAGAMGGALIAGWRRAGAVAAGDILVLDPRPGPEALAAHAEGTDLRPSDAELGRARTLVFAVKSQAWRAVAAGIEPHLRHDAAIVSVVAGVSARDLRAAFSGRPVVRVMPSLAAAIGQGSIALWSANAALAGEVAALFAPLGTVSQMADEELIHAATAVSGSAPAYLYAFIEALEVAATEVGLPPADAARMVRATICGAAALLEQGEEEPAELRRRVTSPGGTTKAALDVLLGEGGLGSLMSRAVAAAAARSRELGA
jgi:pyrroline-5-carboxylate reductase